MAAKSSTTGRLNNLQRENAELKAEIIQLQRQLSQKQKSSKAEFRHKLRSIFAALFLALAVALLITGNLLFWTGNTIVKTDRYEQAVQPLIKDAAIQEAIATYTTDKIFSNIDSQAVIQDVLPPRADFLAPTLASQLQSQTKSVLQKALSKPEVQDSWNRVQINAHDRFIDHVGQHGADGVIDVSEFYQSLSNNLKGTKLEFLADRPLPDKIGSIEVVKGNNLAILHRVINKIDLWRTLAIIFFLLSATLAIWLSRRRRRMVVKLGLFTAIALFINLLSLRIIAEIATGRVNDTYQEAARSTVKIILHPFVIQSITLLCLFLLVAIVAWISGASKSAANVKAKTSDLLSGNLHDAIMNGKENKFTLWMGYNKRWMEWTIVTLALLIALAVPLKASGLIIAALLALILVLLLETLSAGDINHGRKSQV